jgi:hypothetical protein
MSSAASGRRRSRDGQVTRCPLGSERVEAPQRLRASAFVRRTCLLTLTIPGFFDHDPVTIPGIPEASQG